MGNMAGSVMVAELQRRLTNLSPTSATDALNRAQRWILRQGTFLFRGGLTPQALTIVAQTAPKAAECALAFDMDPGKAKMMFNADGTVVQHVAWSDFWESVNYNLPASASYDTYTIRSGFAGATNSHMFYFWPNQSGSATFYYHRVASSIINDPAQYSELPPDFDDLVIDLAEAEERRIYDVGDSWQLLIARAQDQIKVLLDGYRSETQQATGLQDAQTKIQEETALGRS